MTPVALKRLASVAYGLGQPPTLSDSGVAILRATNIERGRINPKDLIFADAADLPLDRCPPLREGECLVVRSGAYTGDSAMITPAYAGSSPGYDLRVSPGSDLHPRFLAYTLLGRRALEAMWLASSRAAQPHLNAEELREVRIHAYPLAEQKAIADFLDTETARIDALISKKRRMIDLIREQVHVHTSALLWSSERRTRLGHLTNDSRPIMYGIVLPGPDVGPEFGVPIVKGGNVAKGLNDPSRLARTTPEIEAPFARARLRQGDLVFAIRGSVGDVGEVGQALEGANITQDVARVSPADGVSSRWLLHVLRSSPLQDEAAVRTTGATIRGLNIGELKLLTVPLVHLSDQQRLARECDRIDQRGRALHTALTRQIDLLVEHRQALITAAVTGELEIPGVAA